MMEEVNVSTSCKYQIFIDKIVIVVIPRVNHVRGLKTVWKNLP